MTQKDLQGLMMVAMKRKVALPVAILVLTAWLIGLGGYPLFQWTALNCRHQDIDILSGRVRNQRFLAGMLVQESIIDSPISAVLSKTSSEPDWRRVNTFSPLVHYSPHYLFHGAISQSDQLRMLWEFSDFTPAARTQSCQDVLGFWQNGQNYETADVFLESLFQTVGDRPAGAPPLDVADLPPAGGR